MTLVVVYYFHMKRYFRNMYRMILLKYFQVSKAFEFLKGIKEEYRKDFAALAAQCDKFAYDFLSQCQTPNEARDLLGRAGFLDEAMDANKKDVSRIKN